MEVKGMTSPRPHRKMEIQSSTMTMTLPSPHLHACALYFKSWEMLPRICSRHFAGRSSLALPVPWSSQMSGGVNQNRSGHSQPGTMYEAFSSAGSWGILN